jgi:Domain of unknown function (DUF4832)/Domain of unknown function (DUF4874)
MKVKYTYRNVVFLVLILGLLVLVGCNQNQSVTNEPSELAVQATNLTVKVGFSEDDVDAYTCSGCTSTVDKIQNNLFLAATYQSGGSPIQKTGVRFRNVTIPKGSTIVSATLSFTASQNGTAVGTSGIKIYGINEDNTGVWTTLGDFNARPRTSALNYTPSAWVANTAYGFDVKSIVQAIVNRGYNANAGNWQANALAFSVDSLNIAGDLKAYSFDGDTTSGKTRTPVLTISYNPPGGTTQNLTYTKDNSNFTNPERGYAQSETTHAGSSSPKKLRDNVGLAGRLSSANITLVHRNFNLKDFKNSAISQSYLDLVEDDLRWARENSLKMTIRFAYNFYGDSNPTDAPLTRVLGHIDQLGPVLQSNVDVIAFIEAGFIGDFGEWDGSQNGLNTPANEKQILDRLLSVLPNQRVVVVRTPRAKVSIYPTLGTNPDLEASYVAITQAQAFPSSGTRSNQARTGHHNDCFVNGYEDGGTYDYHNPPPQTSTLRNKQKDYLSAENLYLPQSGEVCGAYNVDPGIPPTFIKSSPSPYHVCSYVLGELTKMKWSILNALPSDYVTGWTNAGCYNTITTRLGYRFFLTSASMPTSVTRGQSLSLTLNMTNEGFATVYNPRGLEIVLRKTGTTGAGTRLPYNPGQDVRLFLPNPGASKALNVAVTVPSTLTTGTYDVFLNLPDPVAGLSTNPKYSMRLANTTIWESSTGYNKLGSLTIQ